MKSIKTFSCLFLLISLIGPQMKAIEKKPIVVVIPSYKNKKWYRKNLKSVLSQEYSNYSVIYTDDCSPDYTGSLVNRFLKRHDHEHKVTLIRNPKRLGALHNLYNMIHMCDDNAIIVTLDGDDWFPDNQVLKRLNKVYSSSEVWLTYGQFKMYPSNTIGWATAMPEDIVKNNAFRDYAHLPTHLRTFYAWLFKAIKFEDFLYLGDFFPMTWDMTMMFPMIEMAGERHMFIPDVMYMYNDANSISDHRVSRQLQAHLAQVMRAKKRYERLEQKRISSYLQHTTADVIVFSDDSPHDLQQFVDMLKQQISGVGTVHVLYYASNTEIENQYNHVKRQFHEINFSKIKVNRSNFHKLFKNTYNNIKNDYVLFVKDNTGIKQTINLNECIYILEATQAYGFYFKLNNNSKLLNGSPALKLMDIGNEMCVWNFAMGRDVWSCANSLDMVLYRKTEEFNRFLQAHYEPTPTGFEAIWANEGNLDRMGICYKKSHITKKTFTEPERKKQIKQEKNRQKRLVKIQAKRKNKKEGNE